MSMDGQAYSLKLGLLVGATRPKFIGASVAPVVVGSVLGFAMTGEFSVVMFGLAVVGIALVHSGANMANDYFDHLSKNDWVNDRPTPFSGGRRYIQTGLMSPRQTLIESIVLLAAGAGCGIVIVMMTKSIFILTLGVLGVLGGWFYTSPPLKLGYRTIGEPIIGFLFGILPVTGAYYLQVQSLEWLVVVPAVVMGLLIFLVILINGFPDYKADAEVDKKTFVVRFGPKWCAVIYELAVIISYIVMIAGMAIFEQMRLAGLLYLVTMPLAIAAVRCVREGRYNIEDDWAANRLTILLHLAAAVAMTVGFLMTGFLR